MSVDGGVNELDAVELDPAGVAKPKGKPTGFLPRKVCRAAVPEITGRQLDGLPTGGIDRHLRPTPSLSFLSKGLELKNQRLLFRNPGGIDAELDSGGSSKAWIWKIRLGGKVATRHRLDLEHAPRHALVTDVPGYDCPFQEHSLRCGPAIPQPTGLIKVLKNLGPKLRGCEKRKEEKTRKLGYGKFHEKPKLLGTETKICVRKQFQK